MMGLRDLLSHSDQLLLLYLLQLLLLRVQRRKR
jgi:hypothetical protein